ncbi:hypothetical protein [Streptomyces sp. ML-6]|uniref:hypothetical protein n=1 Tax=Streptomyces sp. ML-6 TaxID=2982693 RepID=UPI0024BF652E|nr:hypothetical protein [Streptomyces sp. ML-6]MDK0524882.1 hypothetical protein [Streptomyces sp. ML-6]
MSAELMLLGLDEQTARTRRYQGIIYLELVAVREPMLRWKPRLGAGGAGAAIGRTENGPRQAVLERRSARLLTVITLGIDRASRNPGPSAGSDVPATISR